jgi:hypothetical protein
MYDPNLGHRGSFLGGQEELAVLNDMLKSGYHGFWVPTARIYHHIPKERQTLRYLRKRFFDGGRMAHYSHKPDGSAQLLGRSRWLYRQAIQMEIKYQISRLFQSPEIWIDYLKKASEAWGQLAGYKAAHHRSATYIQ